MLNLRTTNKFEREYKKIARSGKNLGKLKDIMVKLANGEQLPEKHRDHKLIGNFKGRRECHVEPDWLLIYKLTESEIIFERTGSHSELFR